MNTKPTAEPLEPAAAKEADRKPAMAEEADRKPAMAEEPDQEQTFVVRMKYHQNYTWQGEVLYMGDDRREYFRSEVELIRMMSRILDEGKTE